MHNSVAPWRLPRSRRGWERREFHFTIESRYVRTEEMMTVANSKAAIRGNLRSTGGAMETSYLAGNAAERKGELLILAASWACNDCCYR